MSLTSILKVTHILEQEKKTFYGKIICFMLINEMKSLLSALHYHVPKSIIIQRNVPYRYTAASIINNTFQILLKNAGKFFKFWM